MSNNYLRIPHEEKEEEKEEEKLQDEETVALLSVYNSIDTVDKQNHSTPYNDNTDSQATEPMVGGQLLGDDMVFCATFLISFLAGLIGYLFGFCLTSSISGCCGAKSGFGLHLIKLCIIFFTRYYKDDKYIKTDRWIFYMALILGIITLIHGIYIYIKAKYTYHRLNMPQKDVI